MATTNKDASRYTDIRLMDATRDVVEAVRDAESAKLMLMLKNAKHVPLEQAIADARSALDEIERDFGMDDKTLVDAKEVA